MISASVTLKAQFYDLDPMQVVWHGNYPRFLEQARCALLDKIAFNYAEMAQTRYVWPIVDMHVKYVQAARFGDRLRVQASLVEWESRLTINYLVSQAASDERVARARTVQVAVEASTGVLQFATPGVLLERVAAAHGYQKESG